MEVSKLIVHIVTRKPLALAAKPVSECDFVGNAATDIDAVAAAAAMEMPAGVCNVAYEQWPDDDVVHFTGDCASFGRQAAPVVATCHQTTDARTACKFDAMAVAGTTNTHKLPAPTCQSKRCSVHARDPQPDRDRDPDPDPDRERVGADCPGARHDNRRFVQPISQPINLAAANKSASPLSDHDDDGDVTIS